MLSRCNVNSVDQKVTLVWCSTEQEGLVQLLSNNSVSDNVPQEHEEQEGL